MALDRLLPLIAVAGVDNTRRLSVEEVNRWYEVTQQDDPAARTAARLPAARAPARDRRPARGCDRVCPKRRPATRADLAAGRDPAGAAGRGGRASPRRSRAARLDRDRRDGADRPSSRRRSARSCARCARRARTRRRACSRSKSRSPRACEGGEEEARARPHARGRGLPRDAAGRARRLAQHARRLWRRSRQPQTFLARRQQKPAGADTDGAARLPEVARLCRHDAAHRGAPAVGDPPVLPLPAGRADARRRSGEHAQFAQARPAAAQGACRASRSTG